MITESVSGGRGQSSGGFDQGGGFQCGRDCGANRRVDRERAPAGTDLVSTARSTSEPRRRIRMQRTDRDVRHRRTEGLERQFARSPVLCASVVRGAAFMEHGHAKGRRCQAASEPAMRPRRYGPADHGGFVGHCAPRSSRMRHERLRTLSSRKGGSTIGRGAFCRVAELREGDRHAVWPEEGGGGVPTAVKTAN